MSFLKGHRKTLFLFLWILTTLAPFGCVNNRLVSEGRQYADRGNWDKSVRIFQKAYDENPGDQELKLFLYRAKINASLMHQARGAALLKINRFDEAIQEFQVAIALYPANIKAEDLIEKAKAGKDAVHYLKRGENLEKIGKHSQAKEAFRKALELNPADGRARNALARYRKKTEERPRAFRLKVDLKTPVSLKFKNTPILNVFEVLTRLTGVNFIFDKDVQDTKVTLFVTDVSFDEFLDILLRTNKLTSKLVTSKTLIVYPDTPNKLKEYQDLQIRTFYLANLEVKKAVALLAKIIKSKDIIANEKLNAVVIRGPKEVIDVASKVLEANDRPSPEVMLNVEILEVSRSKEKTLGLELDPASVSAQLGESTYGFFSQGSVPAGAGSLHALARTSSENILLSLPTATLNFLKQDGDTKILANPQIRVKNGEKAKIHIGERVPLRTNRRVDTTGAVTTDFQYQDVGVKLDVSPMINLHDEISLKLTLEISSLGENVGSSSDPQYAIKTRTAQSVLSVRTGETVIIGGLISDEERKTVRKVPLLGDIPAMGYLFSNHDTDDTETDIMMAITPIVARSQEIPGPDVTEIWSGRESNFSLQEPYETYLERKETYEDKPMEESPREPKRPSVAIPQKTPSPNDKPGSLPLPDMVPSPTLQKDIPSPGMEVPHPKALPGPPSEPPIPPVIPESRPLQESTPPPISDSLQVTKQAERPRIKAWPSSMPFTIHVNSFIRKKNAEERVKDLLGMDLDGFTLSTFISGKDRVYYRVFVGKFKDYESAEKFCKELKRSRSFREDIHVADRNWAIGG